MDGQQETGAPVTKPVHVGPPVLTNGVGTLRSGQLRPIISTNDGGVL